jgi:hypothetical protein
VKALRVALAADRTLAGAGPTAGTLFAGRALVGALEQLEKDAREAPVRLPAVCDVRRTDSAARKCA